MFKSRDRNKLDIIFSKIIKDEKTKSEHNDLIQNYQYIINALLDVLCEKYRDQTLVIGFGKNVCPIVVQNGERVIESKLKSIHYDWTRGNTESIHIEYENN